MLFQVFCSEICRVSLLLVILFLCWLLVEFVQLLCVLWVPCRWVFAPIYKFFLLLLCQRSFLLIFCWLRWRWWDSRRINRYFAAIVSKWRSRVLCGAILVLTRWAWVVGVVFRVIAGQFLFCDRIFKFVEPSFKFFFKLKLWSSHGKDLTNELKVQKTAPKSYFIKDETSEITKDRDGVAKNSSWWLQKLFFERC